MLEYQILKITIDKESPSAKFYFRLERVGSGSLGGSRDPAYPKDKIAWDHAKNYEKFGELATPLDKAAAGAQTIDVEVLYKDELLGITKDEAYAFKRAVIAKFKENNVDWREHLLNVR